MGWGRIPLRVIEAQVGVRSQRTISDNSDAFVVALFKPTDCDILVDHRSSCLQNQDVQQLSAEIQGLAGAGERLAALREQHAALEREADEAFVLQTQLPELEAVAAQVVMLRKRRNALEADRVRVADLETAIADAENDVSRMPVLESRLQDLCRKQDQVLELEALLVAAPAIEVGTA